MKHVRPYLLLETYRPFGLTLDALADRIRNYEIGNDSLGKIAGDPAAPAEFLRLLASERTAWIVLRPIIQNPNTPADVLAQLANDLNPEVRKGVAEHPNSSAETLAQLASDRWWSVRIQVAGNPNVPVDSLVKLSQDDDPDVSHAATSNPNLSDYDLTGWALDGDNSWL